MNKNALDSGCDELLLAIVPVDEVNGAELGHVKLAHNREVLVQKDELEVRSDHEV